MDPSTVDYCKLLEFFRNKDYHGLHPCSIIDIFWVYEYNANKTPDMKIINQCNDIIKGLDNKLYNEVQERSNKLRIRSRDGFYGLRNKMMKKALNDVGSKLKPSAFYPV